MAVSPEELLGACERARREGNDFPTIWNTLLKHDPLVLGAPTHQVTDGVAQIVVALITGEKLLSSVRGFSLEDGAS